MAKPHFILLHAPSILDFREKVVMQGPISDVVPSTGIFEMYPLGFVSILGYLESRGFNTRIVNLAVRMLRDPSFDLEEYIKHLEPKAFGIDLHWLINAHGTLESAKIIKGHHPDTPVIIGGLSATYYHAEILEKYPQIDYVIRGDSAEEPLFHLLQTVEKGKKPDEIPNLSWRDSSGRIHANPLSYVPEDLEDYSLNYEYVAKSIVKNIDFTGHLPYDSWLQYPFAAIVTCKGCLYNCITCGGSCQAFKSFYGRDKPAFRKPSRIVDEIKIVEEYIKGPVFILGDIRQGGAAYAEEILDLVKKEHVDNPLVFELFTVASSDYIAKISDFCSTFALEISPESHDETVRRLQGRNFNNWELEKTIDASLKSQCEKLDVFFMVGLPGQTFESALDTAGYCDMLMKKYGCYGKLHPFIAPLAPFLDPGSLAFEKPKKYGYQVFFKDFESHKNILENPCWKYWLNYETVWMSKDDIVSSIYEIAGLLINIRQKYGIIDADEAQSCISRIKIAQSVTNRIDEILRISDRLERNRKLEILKNEVEKANRNLLCLKEELRFPCEAKIKKTSAVKLLLRR